MFVCVCVSLCVGCLHMQDTIAYDEQINRSSWHNGLLKCHRLRNWLFVLRRLPLHLINHWHRQHHTCRQCVRSAWRLFTHTQTLSLSLTHTQITRRSQVTSPGQWDLLKVLCKRSISFECVTAYLVFEWRKHYHFIRSDFSFTCRVSALLKLLKCQWIEHALIYRISLGTAVDRLSHFSSVIQLATHVMHPTCGSFTFTLT